MAPCGPASRQEQGSRQFTGSAAAVGLAVRLFLVWMMAEGPRGPESLIYSGGASPVVVAVRRRVVDDGGAGVPRMAVTDTVEPVVTAGAVSCKKRRDR